MTRVGSGSAGTRRSTRSASASWRSGRKSGPEAVAFGRGTGSGTGLTPAEPWLKRLAAAFASPNYLGNTHLCQWARDGISWHTYGYYPMPLPDVANSGCIVLWGANPAATWLGLATEIVKARSGGARLLAVDPRRVGLAAKADLVLQLRPGTDGALALAMIGRLIALRAYDHDFVQRWTNAPLLVRADTGRLLRLEDVTVGAVLERDPSSPSIGEAEGFVAVRRGDRRLVAYYPGLRTYTVPADDLDPFAASDVPIRTGGTIRCRTVFDLLANEAATWPLERAAQVCGVQAAAIEEAVGLMIENRPVSLHTWNGIVQHTNGSQAGRAIEVLFALLGDLDAPGGNVVPMRPRTLDMAGARAVPAEQAAKRLGREERPLGPPAMPGNITAYDLFEAILEARPYRVRGLLSFGNNTLLNTGDPLRGRAAFERLEFFAQAELFQTPTSRYADILLPAADFLETDTLVITADGVAQRRRRSVMPRDERRPDIEVIFELARRMGCDADFGGGEVARAYDQVLEPAGLTWPGLLDAPEGVRVSDPLRHRKYAALDERGTAVGFATRTGLVELFQDRWAEYGCAPATPVRGACREPVADAGGLRGIPLGPDQRQAIRLPPQPAPRRCGPAASGAGPDRGAAPRHGREIWGPRSCVGLARDATRQGPRTSGRHGCNRARNCVCKPWLVGSVRGTRPGGARPVLGGRGQHQPAGRQRPP